MQAELEGAKQRSTTFEQSTSQLRQEVRLNKTQASSQRQVCILLFNIGLGPLDGPSVFVVSPILVWSCARSAVKDMLSCVVSNGGLSVCLVLFMYIPVPTG